MLWFRLTKMGNIYDLGQQSETQVQTGRFWTRSRRSRPQAGAGRRESDRLPQQRSGAGDSQPFQQGITSCGRQARAAGRIYGAEHQITIRAAVLLCAVVMVGCGAHHANPVANVPPSPETGSSASTGSVPAASSTVVEPGAVVPPTAKVIYTETGWASWYGPSYNKRKAANGEVYDMNGMTAAHRTLPLNSIARVTNLKTGHSELLRITDRGPFVNDRIIDLSRTAAQKLDVYRPGTAKVKIEVLQSPASIDQGGRWCIQIGAFKNSEDAAALI